MRWWLCACCTCRVTDRASRLSTSETEGLGRETSGRTARVSAVLRLAAEPASSSMRHWMVADSESTAATANGVVCAPHR
jgi:hypothetical protein